MAADPRLWCEHGLVVVVEGPQGRTLTTTEKPYARVGAHAKSDVVLSGPGVPRRGLYLHATHAGVFCVRLSDEDSAAEPGRGWLLPDQAVLLGPYRVSAHLADAGKGDRHLLCEAPNGTAGGAVRPFRQKVPVTFSGPCRPETGDGRPQALEPDLEARGSAEAPYPVIAVSFAGREVARRRLGRRLTVVGRCRPSTLPIWGSDLSAPHLVFYWEAGVLWAIDLVSRKGTRLDGAPVEVAQVPLGGSVALGDVELTYSGLTGGRSLETGGRSLAAGGRSLETGGKGGLVSIERGLVELFKGESGNCGGLSPCSTLAMLFVQLAAEQLAHEREWLDLAAQRQVIEARLGEQLAAMERLRTELESRMNAMESQQERLALHERTLELEQTPVAQESRTDFQSVPQESRTDFQSVAQESRTDCQSVPQGSTTDFKSVPPSGQPPAEAAAGAQEDFSQAYGQLLDRLIAISRQRSGWWDRVKDSFSRVFAGRSPEADGKPEDPKP